MTNQEIDKWIAALTKLYQDGRAEMFAECEKNMVTVEYLAVARRDAKREAEQYTAALILRHNTLLGELNKFLRKFPDEWWGDVKDLSEHTTVDTIDILELMTEAKKCNEEVP